MAYNHSNRCKVCMRIRYEISGSHKGRQKSQLWRFIEDYHFGTMTMVEIASAYPDLMLKSIEVHKNKHQMLTAEDAITSQIKELQRKSDNEKLQTIFKASLKADDMRSMIKDMLTEIMSDEESREKFKSRLKPSDIIKMANDEDTLELKKVDTAHEIMKTMNAFQSGATEIEATETDAGAERGA